MGISGVRCVAEVIGLNGIVELLYAPVDVCHFAVGYSYFIQGIFLANLDNFWVFFNAQHLVEELKRLIVGFSLGQSLIPQLFLVVLVLGLNSVGRDKSVLLEGLVDLLHRHYLRSVSQAFLTFLCKDFDVEFVRVGNGDATVHYDVDGVCRLAKVHDSRPRLEFVEFDFLQDGQEIARFELLVRLQERHASYVGLDQCTFVRLAIVWFSLESS